MSQSTSNGGSATTDGNALPNRDPPDVTRFRSATAKRVQAHRADPRAVCEAGPIEPRHSLRLLRSEFGWP